MAYAGQEDPVQGDYSDTPSGTAADIPLYLAGTTTAASIGSADQLFVTDITLICGPGDTVDIFSGANGSVANGERILVARWQDAGGPVTFRFKTPHRCIAGTAAKVNALSENVSVTLRGFIRRG